MIKVLFHSEAKLPLGRPAIREIVKTASLLEPKIRGEVEINIVDDKAIKKLNKFYRNKNKTTDVLSFAWQEDKLIKSDFLGQIYISLPQIKRQAKGYKVTEKAELARMMVHGLLHLAGHNHSRAGRAKKMFILQEKILAKINPIK